MTMLMKNLFRNTDDVPLTEEELDAQDAEAKKARIKDHADNVRNGPVKRRYWSSGQSRRAAERRAATRQRKATKAHRQQWKDEQQSVATLRGHLTILGVIECRSATEFTTQQIATSAEWTYLHYAPRDDEGTLLPASEQAMGEAVAAARSDFLKRIGATEEASA